MKAYKGFDKDLKCRDFQYEIGKTYEIPENEVSIYNKGFHACKSPLEVWDYYGIVNGNRFCEVESDGKIESEEENTKICSSKITVKAEIGIKGLVHAMVDFVRESVKDCKINMESGYYAQIGSSGNSAQIGSSGNYAKIGSSGYYAKIGSSGHYAQIGSSGNSAQIGSSGNSAQIGSSGHYAKIGSSGNSAQIDSSGEDSVICCAGNDSIARAKKGSWITLSEWEYSGKKKSHIPVCVKTEYVDGERIKADTWYKLENGKFMEVEE